MVKNLPAMQETQVGSLSWEDPLEKGRQPIQYHFQDYIQTFSVSY